MFFLLFFITPSHLSNSGRGKGTAHTSPGPAGGRGRLVIRHSRFSSPKCKRAASAAVISCCPSKQETSLEFQTHLLNCITKLVVLPDPCKCLLNVKVAEALRGWWTGRASVFGRGHYLAQLPAMYWVVLEMKQAQQMRRTHKVTRSISCQQGESHPCARLNPLGVL